MTVPMNTAPVNSDSTPDVPSTRVLCVDDNQDLTAALRMVIDSEPKMQCVGCLTSADDLIEKVRRLGPLPASASLVILLDATMPGKDPFAAMSELAAEFPRIKTVVYSGHDDPDFIDKAVSAGAWGCVSKHEDPRTILEAVREVAAGNFWSPRRLHGG